MRACHIGIRPARAAAAARYITGVQSHSGAVSGSSAYLSKLLASALLLTLMFALSGESSV